MSAQPLTVIITGASSGIGLALAQAYAHDGANLVLVARDHAKLVQASASLDERAATPSLRV